MARQHETNTTPTKPRKDTPKILAELGGSRPRGVNPYDTKNLVAWVLNEQVTHEAHLDRTPPIASVKRFSGNATENLTHLIVLGDTVLGVTTQVNQKPGVEGRIEEIRVAILPFGAHDRPDLTDAPTDLLKVRPALLQQPRSDGIIQDFETVVVGGRDIAAATGVVDQYVSAKNTEITVTADGRLKVGDLSSTNGTQVFDAIDFAALGSKDESGTLRELNDFLTQNAVSWSSRDADTGMRVINPL